MLKLMYITNRPDVARIAENAGVDRIFVDMEYIGKDIRQGGMDTVQSHHTVSDIKNIRQTIKKAELLVRCNPIHEATDEYSSSVEEINAIVEAGADIIMLPYFKTVDEARQFLGLVAGRTKTILLVETIGAVEHIDEIIELPDVDEVYIGLNDLSIAYGKKFMFELLADGTVERLCLKFKQKNMVYGFGGIAAIGTGTLPAEAILKEHYRLGSSCVILARAFCDANKISDIKDITARFEAGVKAMRDLEAECELHSRYFRDNERTVAEKVRLICEE